MRYIVLDISSKTGWAYFEATQNGLQLLGRGQREQVPMPKHGVYPENYLEWSKNIFNDIVSNVLEGRQFDYLVIEETAKGSKDAHAQKILEWVHYHVAGLIQFHRKQGDLKGAHYLQTGEWRQTAGCQMTNEEKKRNKKVRKGRSVGKMVDGKLVVPVLIDIDGTGKKVGLVSKKHIALRRVKEIFDIDLAVKQNDEADALLIGFAAYERFFKKKLI